MSESGLRAWTTDLTARLRWARGFRAAVWGARERLIELVCAETHKPRHEALTGDLMPLLAACVWHERHARRLLSGRGVGGRPALFMGQRHRVERHPLGRVAIIATWNYPVQLLGIQLVQALVAGNRVVVKPSEHTPMTQGLLLELAAGAAGGLPEGVLTWTEATREAGPRLLEAGAIDHLVFTGSTAVGRQVAAWAAEGLIPTTLELSGCDSALVLADADPALAAERIWAGITMNGGQTCMAPRRVLVDRAIYPAFVAAVSPLAAGAKARRLINAGAAAKAYALAKGAVEAGGRSVSGVLEEPRAWAGGGDAAGVGGGVGFVPVLVADCPTEGGGGELLKGEHFSPVAGVVACAGVEEMVRVHRACGQHLATAVFTRRPDGAVARELVGCLRSGYVTFNDCLIPQAHPGTAIVGTGQSGWGASRGEAGLLAMTRAVTVSATKPMFRAPVGEPTRAALRTLERVMGWLYGRGSAAAGAGGAGSGRGVAQGGGSEAAHAGVGEGAGVSAEPKPMGARAGAA